MLATAAHATGVADTSNRWMTFGGTISTGMFAGVAALNFLITVNGGRGRDLATMALPGGPRRTLLRASTIETLVFAATGLLIAGAISASTLIPITYSAYHLWIPYLPLWTVAVGVLAVIGLIASAMVGTASRPDQTQPHLRPPHRRLKGYRPALPLRALSARARRVRVHGACC